MLNNTVHLIQPNNKKCNSLKYQCTLVRKNTDIYLIIT